MPDSFIKAIEFIPFMTLVNGKPELNTSRITEAVIIAAICSAMTAYITLQKMEIKFDNLEKDNHRIEKKVNQIYSDLYKPSLDNTK
jgi:hypothetical protein